MAGILLALILAATTVGPARVASAESNHPVPDRPVHGITYVCGQPLTHDSLLFGRHAYPGVLFQQRASSSTAREGRVDGVRPDRFLAP